MCDAFIYQNNFVKLEVSLILNLMQNFFNKIKSFMANITINKTTYTGSNVSIVNGKVYIDGKDVTPDGKEINISVEGNLDKLEVEHCNRIDIKGAVKDIRSASGDVNIIGDVLGSIDTKSGDVEVSGTCSDSIKTISGDINCGNVSGNISTISGDVRNKK